MSNLLFRSLYNTISSSTSDNFECGFYSIVLSLMRYRFNYWMVIFHYLIFELELLMSLFLIFGLVSFNSNNMVCILLSLLFIELIINSIKCSFINSIFIIWIPYFPIVWTQLFHSYSYSHLSNNRVLIKYILISLFLSYNTETLISSFKI